MHSNYQYRGVYRWNQTPMLPWVPCTVVITKRKHKLHTVIIFGLRFAFFTHMSGKKRTVSKYVRLKNAMIFDNLKEVISEWRSAKERRFYQSSWITWPIWLWLLWGIVLWKESLCKTWIVFILIKCICFIIKINHVWSRVKNIALKKHCSPPPKKKTPLFSQKPIVFQHVHFFIPLFWNEKLSLTA